MSDEHTFRPSDEFRARLEREVLLRHRSLPAGPMPGPTGQPRTRVAALVVISLVLGATGGFASAQIGRNEQRDSLLATARAEAMLVDAQRDLARAEIREVEQKFRQGMVGPDASFQANADLADAERRRNRLAIDIEEITATGTSPRDDLNAPLVAGRDFVKLRIEIDAVGAQARLRAAESRQRMMDARVQVGIASAVASSAAALDTASVRGELAMLAEKLALRTQFLATGMSIEAMTRRLHAAQLTQDSSLLGERFKVASERLAAVEKQWSLGTVGEVELLRARLDVKETALGYRKILEQLRQAMEEAREAARR